MAATIPPLWQSDVLQSLSSQQDGSRGAVGGSRSTYDPSQLSETYRAARAVEARRDVDLYDLLANTRREETYQPYFQGWPSLLRPLTPTMCDMPAMVQEKYRACQTMCFCGLFPEIGHAWASIDNCLYLWRYDRSGDVPVSYCGEEQAICAVGLVRPRPGVFLEAIQYLAVLATTTEIVLLGVCPTARAPGGAGSLQPSLALQPLPMYSVPSDNVVMTCVTGTAAGRIFLGGSDGHLYELQYAAADSWRQKRCTKVRITGKLQQLLPSFVPALLGGLGGPQAAVERVVVDDDRHILYTLKPPGHLQVYDLGRTGMDKPTRVTEMPDFYQQAANATGGRDVFRNAAGERKSAAVKYITPIPPAESSKLHLLAITADGRRVYLTTHQLRTSLYYYSTTAGQPASNGMAPAPAQADPAAVRPTTLQAVFARAALPNAAGMALPRAQPDGGRPAAGVEVVTAHYSSGVLLLSQAAGGDGRATQLLLAARNSTLPLASSLALGAGAGGPAGAAASMTGAQGLRELLSQLDASVPGETCAIAAVPGSGLLQLLPPALPGAPGGVVGGVPGPHEELVAQLFSPPPRFVLISTAGVVELEKRRPLEVLAVLLEERNTARIVDFFGAYGAAEAAAMCVALACSPPGTLPAVVYEEAAACLDNAALVGEARMPQDITAPSTALADAQAGAAGGSTGAGGIYMGQAVNPHPEPDWSAGHRGLCLAVVRLLAPVWEAQMATTSGSGAAALVQLSLPRPALELLASKLRAVEQFLGTYLQRRQQRGTLARYANSLASGAEGVPQGVGGGYAATGLFGSIQQQQQEEGLAVQAAKRQRLAAACQLEDERTRRLRALVGKAAQALALLQLLAAHNLGRIAALLGDSHRKQLLELALRDLVCEARGEALATQLISGLVSQQLDVSAGVPGAGGAVGGVEAVAALLQRHCPAFFKEDDRLFYQASAQLRAAEGAAPGGERDALVSRALGVLVRVPLSANLEQLTAQLAHLQAYAAMAQVPLAAAAALDPSNAALRTELGSECAAARQRRREAYQPLLNALRSYATGGPNPGAAAAVAAGTSPEAAAAPLPAAQRSAAKTALLRAALAASDPYFHTCLYEALIEVGEAGTLLATGAPHLHAYLVEHSGLAGGLSAASSGAEPPPVGPLSPGQVQLAELLAKLLISQRQFREAAAVYKCLAVRRSGTDAQAVPLSHRVQCLQAAVLQARSVGDSGLVAGLEADARLMDLQDQCAQRVEALQARMGKGSAEAEELSRQATDLAARPLDVTQLYNDVAQPLRLWDVCLQLVHFAGGSAASEGLVRQLWDHALLAAGEERGAGAGSAEGLAAAAALVERLGAQFYPNQASYPMTHVVFRLMQMACGRWPPGATEQPAAAMATAQVGEEVVSRALLATTGGAFMPVLRACELLLLRRAPDVPEPELAPLPLRLALLRCLAHCCAAALAELNSSLVTPGLAPLPAAGGAAAAGAAAGLSAVPGVMAQREAGSLAEACERFALEARRIGTPDAAALADSFATVRRGLQARLGSVGGR